MLDQHPPHVKKRIALGITIAVGVLLLGLLAVMYIGGKRTPPDTANPSALSNFYTTILESGQSLFRAK